MTCSLELKCKNSDCNDCPYYDDTEEDTREVRTTCDDCGKNLYEGDTYWGNNQIGTYCEECAEKEIAEWWGTIY